MDLLNAHGTSIEAMEKTVARASDEVQRFDLDLRDLRAKLRDVQVELISAQNAAREGTCSDLDGMRQKLSKEHKDRTAELEAVRAEFDGKLDAEVGELKKQMESYISGNIQQLEIALCSTAKREHLQEALRSKADKGDLVREIEMVKSMLNQKYDVLMQELHTKAYSCLRLHCHLPP
jgi:hypothetical protein